jgi:hypothetical protein
LRILSGGGKAIEQVKQRGEIMKKVCRFLLVVSILFLCSGKTYAQGSYTTIKPDMDLSKYNAFTISSEGTDDTLLLKGIIVQEVMKLGFNVIDTITSDKKPDVIVKYSYSRYKRIIRFRNVHMLDNFVVTFIDREKGNVILTSGYPKPMPVVNAQDVVRIVFTDIKKAMKK